MSGTPRPLGPGPELPAALDASLDEVVGRIADGRIAFPPASPAPREPPSPRRRGPPRPPAPR